ncbi:uridine kinase [Lutispora saccharofermentans]|uniref:Uridine kinase n=1 Tax=Lutispora saccharofermentans TaxID=3024236 RepID=A0ABT1NFF0_9FIRM|nr:uridine kinase [Lutispora saccharofermentans]MCQ1529794.1 uridine kinase [Lutispora saccharofermentans]
MSKPLLIGITGGTGSGKSTVARAIYESLPKSNISIIEQDSYYKDQSHLSSEERIKTNYDHPFAFDTDLLVSHLKDLLNNKPIEKPLYDFTVHNRKKETVRIEAREIIILEGILILDSPEIRELLDIKIFVDTDADVRIIRRILRDMEERGRSLDSIIKQYMEVVKPMHYEFIEPTKRYADIIIPEGGYNRVAIDIIVAKINSILNTKGDFIR